nr:glycosyltransferase 87 family protein [Candidatus Eremiobacteraeota bacterium]
MPTSYARHLSWLLAPAILAALIALNPLSRPTYVMGDFRAFYCAGAVIAQHANPYLEEPLRGCERDAGPPAEPAFLRPVALPAPLPPFALALFVPFGLLPFPVAAVLYGVILIAAMTGATVLYARVTGVSSVVAPAFNGFCASISFMRSRSSIKIFED